ncbi:MAG: phosphoribosylformylglycinamidine cyclo-ligase [Armatimonadota bacterium]|nr:phosphoribosylformylglycinamidine cyclo-ligase [Armatimonadota bacterium]
MPDQEVTYKSAGVDIDAMTGAIHRMKESLRSTFNESVLTDVGAFGGMYSLGRLGESEPVLVSSIDGVGTKVKIAALTGRYDTIGADLVNHCVNDILALGARPLFFLDYFATSKLDRDVLTEVVKGMAKACRAADCALIGGETAEMPSVYCEGEFDLAGCIVGVVDRSRIVDGTKVSAGDVLVGVASSGLHTNGYSLVRKLLLEECGMRIDQYVPELAKTLGDELLEPHRCYYKPVRTILANHDVHAMAHLTGGGFYDNIPRVLPEDCQVTIERRSWARQPIFNLIQERGAISEKEMYHTFNMGVGLVMIVPKEQAIGIVAELDDLGETAWIIGEVHKGGREVAVL